jgi:hypothetical protein
MAAISAARIAVRHTHLPAPLRPDVIMSAAPLVVLGHGKLHLGEQSSSALRQTVVFRLHDVEKGAMRFL